MILGSGTLAFGKFALAAGGAGGLVTPPYQGSIMGLVGADTPVGYGAFAGFMFVDHVGQKLYFMTGSTITGSPGIKKIDSAVPGDELLQHTEAAYFSGAHVFNGIGCFHPNGRLFASLDASNSRPFASIKGSDLSLVGVFGVNSSSLAASANGTPLRLVASFQMCGLQADAKDYLLSRGFTGAGGEREIDVLDVTNDGATLVYVERITEEVAALCPGYSDTTKSFATFYVLGRLFDYMSGDPTPAVLYEYIVGDTVMKRRIRSIAPTDIDPAWTNFTAISDPGFDKADGGVLAFFQTQDAVTNTVYLVKFARASGAIVWKLALADGLPSVDLAQASINGTFEFFTQFSGTSFTTRVNLADGTTTTALWNNGITGPPADSQVFDYLTGSVTASMGYTQSTGPIPTYIGDYLPAHGDVIPGYRWGRLYTGAPYPNDADDQPSNGPGGVQRRVAWSFALDGHTFYVLDLGDEGTFIWDDITKHWASFVTSSTDPQWNMAGGCMWGDRIVAGDLSSGQVWELNPNAVQDNGALDILHVATGIVTRRSRNYLGVGAVRVAASIGQIQDVGGATISLRFSDDQGQTWSDYYTVTLTEGDYSDEIAFRGLGSFAAPGRVFELSDTGGLIRIDGCDMDPEKDDDEKAG